MTVGKFFTVTGFALAAALVSAVSANAEDVSNANAPVAQIAAPPVQLAMAYPVATAVTPGDGLHQDARWPQFANCVNNTSAQSEFVSCLRSAFLADATGTEAQLLRN